MKLIKYSLVVLLLIGAIAQEEVSAIRVNEDPAPAPKKEEKAEAAEKSTDEKAGDEIVKATKKGGEEEGKPNSKSPYCALEGK